MQAWDTAVVSESGHEPYNVLESLGIYVDDTKARKSWLKKEQNIATMGLNWRCGKISRAMNTQWIHTRGTDVRPIIPNTITWQPSQVGTQ